MVTTTPTIANINAVAETNPTIVPKVVVTYPTESYLGIGAMHHNYVFNKLGEPLSQDDSLDSVVDNDKLYFLDDVKFPRRKLTMLTENNGKLSNISTVRKLSNATKIISNKAQLKGCLSKLDINYKKNFTTHARTYMLLINTVCRKDSPNGKYTVGDKISYTIQISDTEVLKKFIKNDFKYITADQLAVHGQLVLDLLHAQINEPSILAGVSYYGSDSWLDKMTQLNQQSYKKSNYLNIVDIELIVSHGLTSNGGIDGDYVECINNGYKVVDVSKVFSAIGTEEMTYDRFLDTTTTLNDALNSNNSNIIKMMLESLTSYDIDSSIFYLSLIFRNANKFNSLNGHMNTSVRALYELCDSKSNFSRCSSESSTTQIIHNLSKCGYKMKVPLSFLLTEVTVDGGLNKATDQLLKDCDKKGFDLDIKYRVKLKEDLISHIVCDVDIDDFNSYVLKSNDVSTIPKKEVIV